MKKKKEKRKRKTRNKKRKKKYLFCNSIFNLSLGISIIQNETEKKKLNENK